MIAYAIMGFCAFHVSKILLSLDKRQFSFHHIRILPTVNFQKQLHMNLLKYKKLLSVITPALISS